jgi:cell division cycle protein 20 (cofactor of APC complex)
LQLDRFIPNRSALDFDVAQFNLSNENVCSDVDGPSPSKDEYKKLLAASLNVGDSSRILSFKQKAPAPPPGHESNLASLYNNNMGQAPSRKHFRHVPTTQDRILDAPDIVDDYYLNLLDWSSQNLVGGVAHSYPCWLTSFCWPTLSFRCLRWLSHQKQVSQ